MIRIKTHPGKILKEEFLVPLEMSARALAEAIGVPPNRITAIINQHRGVTADTAIRLSRFFGTSSELWTGLQQDHDLSVAQAENGKTYAKIRPRAVHQTA